MLVLDALFPVLVLIALGWLLRRFGLTTSSFLQTTDRLVYYIFFPVMLFWKVGSASYTAGALWNLCLALLLALSLMVLLSLAAIKLFKITDFQAGSFAQSCYRFNTYIGVAIILNGFGESGIGYFGVLIGIIIPVINVVAVWTLIVYSRRQKVSTSGREKRLIFRALLSNPLILGCLAGLGYSRIFSGFAPFINNSLQLISMVTLPLALLSIGGSLRLAGLRKFFSLSLAAAAIKLVAFPFIGYCCLTLAGVEGLPFSIGMIFCALPTSTAIYVLSSQMHSDPELASSAILVSTAASFPVLTVVLFIVS